MTRCRLGLMAGKVSGSAQEIRDDAAKQLNVARTAVGLAIVGCGKTEASTMNRLLKPWTWKRSSTTGPIAHVPPGW